MNKIDKEKLPKKPKGIIHEFKEFISRGNVIDLAVGVIIGTAFSNIIISFTKILTDLIGTIFGGINLRGLKYTIGNLTVEYGIFFQAVFDFLVTAICIFILIKVINKLHHKKEKPPVPPKREEIILLEEIRDLLKETNKTKKTK